MAPSRRRLLGGLASALLVPLGVLACNGIIGLSDYDRVECTGLVCDGGSSFDVTSPDGGGDASPDATKVDASGTAPVSWAAWRMPNYVPPDASPDATDNPMKYSPATAGGFVDDVTKLVWAHPMPAEAGNQTLEGAKDLCAKLPNGPWRVPSRIELVTLLDLSTAPGIAKVDATFRTGTGTPSAAHWTSSEVRPFGTPERLYWVVDFGKGGLDKRPEVGGNAAVRCVRDGT